MDGKTKNGPMKKFWLVVKIVLKVVSALAVGWLVAAAIVSAIRLALHQPLS